MRRIVVVEDNPADAKVLRVAMHRTDPSIELILLEDGEKALEFFGDAKRPYCALVLLDLNLPIVSGFEVLKHLKSDSVLKTVPVVVLSGSSNPDDIERCYQLGANSYLCKPAGIEAVFAMAAEIVRYWFDHSIPPPCSPFGGF